MKARSFFFLCSGIFLLAAAFHLGAMTATAQSGTGVVAMLQGVTANGRMHAMTASGDLYSCTDDIRQWTWTANIFGGPTPATQPTWGQVKAKYRPGAATQDK
jgi:hypothetical protein